MQQASGLPTGEQSDRVNRGLSLGAEETATSIATLIGDDVAPVGEVEEQAAEVEAEAATSVAAVSGGDVAHAEDVDAGEVEIRAAEAAAAEAELMAQAEVGGAALAAEAEMAAKMAAAAAAMEAEAEQAEAEVESAAEAAEGEVEEEAEAEASEADWEAEMEAEAERAEAEMEEEADRAEAEAELEEEAERAEADMEEEAERAEADLEEDVDAAEAELEPEERELELAGTQGETEAAVSGGIWAQPEAAVADATMEDAAAAAVHVSSMKAGAWAQAGFEPPHSEADTVAGQAGSDTGDEEAFELSVQGLDEELYEEEVEPALKHLQGVRSCALDLASGRVSVIGSRGVLTLPGLVAALAGEGILARAVHRAGWGVESGGWGGGEVGLGDVPGMHAAKNFFDDETADDPDEHVHPASAPYPQPDPLWSGAAAMDAADAFTEEQLGGERSPEPDEGVDAMGTGGGAVLAIGDLSIAAGLPDGDEGTEASRWAGASEAMQDASTLYAAAGGEGPVKAGMVDVSLELDAGADDLDLDAPEGDLDAMPSFAHEEPGPASPPPVPAPPPQPQQGAEAGGGGGLASVAAARVAAGSTRASGALSDVSGSGDGAGGGATGAGTGVAGAGGAGEQGDWGERVGERVADIAEEGIDSVARAVTAVLTAAGEGVDVLKVRDVLRVGAIVGVGGVPDAGYSERAKRLPSHASPTPIRWPILCRWHPSRFTLPFHVPFPTQPSPVPHHLSPHSLPPSGRPFFPHSPFTRPPLSSLRWACPLLATWPSHSSACRGAPWPPVSGPRPRAPWASGWASSGGATRRRQSRANHQVPTMAKSLPKRLAKSRHRARHHWWSRRSRRARTPTEPAGQRLRALLDYDD
jgi:hypothetical protein